MNSEFKQVARVLIRSVLEVVKWELDRRNSNWAASEDSLNCTALLQVCKDTAEEYLDKIKFQR